MKDFISPEIQQTRTSDYPINPLILNRWSPRAMTGEPLSDSELFPLFEAARWAPSSYNAQPWRILCVKRDSPHWDTLFQLLIDFNKGWCVKAAVLGLFFSRTTFEKTNKPSHTHAFDSGAAWGNLCLEGSSRGLVVHGMEGFDYEKAKQLIPENHEVHAMFAIGKRASKSSLSPELQQKEIPSTRKKISEFVKFIS
ncbi:MAG TPA: nitroreductase family protein [Chlamydiales bacterium]|nr:nitroreductase family protein [Chlamydiales bacterium]